MHFHPASPRNNTAFQPNSDPDDQRKEATPASTSASQFAHGLIQKARVPGVPNPTLTFNLPSEADRINAAIKECKERIAELQHFDAGLIENLSILAKEQATLTSENAELRAAVNKQRGIAADGRVQKGGHVRNFLADTYRNGSATMQSDGPGEKVALRELAHVLGTSEEMERRKLETQAKVLHEQVQTHVEDTASLSDENEAIAADNAILRTQLANGAATGFNALCARWQGYRSQPTPSNRPPNSGPTLKSTFPLTPASSPANSPANSPSLPVRTAGVVGTPFAGREIHELGTAAPLRLKSDITDLTCFFSGNGTEAYDYIRAHPERFLLRQQASAPKIVATYIKDGKFVDEVCAVVDDEQVEDRGVKSIIDRLSKTLTSYDRAG